MTEITERHKTCNRCCFRHHPDRPCRKDRSYFNKRFGGLNAKISAPRKAVDARARELNVPKQTGDK